MNNTIPYLNDPCEYTESFDNVFWCSIGLVGLSFVLAAYFARLRYVAEEHGVSYLYEPLYGGNQEKGCCLSTIEKIRKPQQYPIFSFYLCASATLGIVFFLVIGYAVLPKNICISKGNLNCQADDLPSNCKGQWSLTENSTNTLLCDLNGPFNINFICVTENGNNASGTVRIMPSQSPYVLHGQNNFEVVEGGTTLADIRNIEVKERRTQKDHFRRRLVENAGTFFTAIQKNSTPEQIIRALRG